MSAERQKGTRWSSEIVRYLREQGFDYAERRALNGAADLGDITGIPGGPVIEAKNQKRHSFAEWLEEAKTEAGNAGAPFGVVWAHRRGKGSAADGFVVLDGAAFVRLLRQAGWGEPPDGTP